MNSILQNSDLKLKKYGLKNSLVSFAATIPFVMPPVAVLLSSILSAAPLHAEYLTVNDLAVLVSLDAGFLFGVIALFIPKKTSLTLILLLCGILLNAVFFLYTLYEILLRTLVFSG